MTPRGRTLCTKASPLSQAAGKVRGARANGAPTAKRRPARTPASGRQPAMLPMTAESLERPAWQDAYRCGENHTVGRVKSGASALRAGRPSQSPMPCKTYSDKRTRRRRHRSAQIPRRPRHLSALPRPSRSSASISTGAATRVCGVGEEAQTGADAARRDPPRDRGTAAGRARHVAVQKQERRQQSKWNCWLM